MELVFQMDNVERGFVMLLDEKKNFKPAVLLYKDEKLKADGTRGGAEPRHHQPRHYGPHAAADS